MEETYNNPIIALKRAKIEGKQVIRVRKIALINKTRGLYGEISVYKLK
jgi:hypothetical protein